VNTDFQELANVSECKCLGDQVTLVLGRWTEKREKSWKMLKFSRMNYSQRRLHMGRDGHAMEGRKKVCGEWETFIISQRRVYMGGDRHSMEGWTECF